jgi:hypothetical protein
MARRRSRVPKPQEYYWKQNSRMHGDPNVIGTHIERLIARHGEQHITPEDLLADGQSPSSPLHDQFEWDDEAAANEYRLVQARKVLRSLVVVYEDGHEEEMATRAFVKIANDESHKYTHIHIAMTDEEIHQEVLCQAMWELRALQQKFRHLRELSRVFQEIDNIEVAAPGTRTCEGRYPGDKSERRAS